MTRRVASSTLKLVPFYGFGQREPAFPAGFWAVVDWPDTEKGPKVASIALTWEGDHRFDAEDRGGMPVDIDGEATVGVRPSDLLPMALAGCSGVDVVEQIGANRLTSLEVTVRYTKEADPPWRFQRFRVHYRAAGPDLTEQELSEAVRRSHDEMCSVSQAIRGNVPVETTVEMV